MRNILTRWQQERFDEFEEAIHKRRMLFRNGEYRGNGKTYLLNELGLTIQALGYRVLVYTPYTNTEYFAENFIYSSDCGSDNPRRIDKLKTAVLFDEVIFDDDETKIIVEYCKKYRIPVVGFVRYKDEEHTRFKMEYKCEWFKDYIKKIK